LATSYLSGSLRQRRTGIELMSLPELWTDLQPAQRAGSLDTAQVTLSELDTAMQQASELGGAGSSRARTDLFLGLVARLTAQERIFVLGLL